jgi:hypothetical protein
MQQQVHMVVHQDVCVDQDAVIQAGFAQQAPVMVPILIVEEDRATVHPALGDMHGNAGHFDSGLTGHRADLVGMPAVFAVAFASGIGETPICG